MQIRPFGLLAALALSIAATGCTTPMSTMPPGTTAYRTGFSEGCDAGYSVAGSPFYEKRDEASPQETDKEYVHGWRQGFHRCKRNYDRIQTTVYAIMGPPL